MVKPYLTEPTHNMSQYAWVKGIVIQDLETTRGEKINKALVHGYDKSTGFVLLCKFDTLLVLMFE